MDAQQFQANPRDFATEFVENQLVSAEHLLTCALKYMSHDDVRDMLDANELSPRFDEVEPEEFELEDEDDVQEAFWDEQPPEIGNERDDDKSQNDYNATIRTAFVDWLDGAAREGRLSSDLAGEVTL